MTLSPEQLDALIEFIKQFAADAVFRAKHGDDGSDCAEVKAAESALRAQLQEPEGYIPQSGRGDSHKIDE